jgi:ABC-type nitrate/sulfonate/bicarbonate transport system permease component
MCAGLPGKYSANSADFHTFHIGTCFALLPERKPTERTAMKATLAIVSLLDERVHKYFWRYSMSEILLIFSVGVVAGIVLGILMVHE